jgi:CRISPR-associated protein Csx16
MRLVSFVGTGLYQETTYTLEGRSYATRYVVEALAHLLEPHPTEIVLLATAEARRTHPDLAARLGSGARFEEIPDGSTEAEQWALFARVRDLLDGPEVVLDVTHGWRAQMFLSGAVLAHLRATRTDAQVRVLYGAFERGRADAPVWDLTALVDLVEWSHALRSLRATGHAAEVAALVEALSKRRRKAWAMGGRQGPEPRLQPFAQALKAFGADLATIRTGALVGRRGSAARLLAEIDGASPDLATLPPLAPVLSEVRETLAPLAAADLSEPAGDHVLAALARLYLDLDRVPEAVTVAREARISRYAPDPAARVPGEHDRPSLAFAAVRDRAEHRWRRFDLAHRPTITSVRNTVDHAGFQSQPVNAEGVRKQAEQAVAAILQPVTTPDPALAPPVFLNVSNHPAAAWSDTQRDAARSLAGGEVVDVPFPVVDPEVESVEPMADQVLALVDGHPGAVVAMVQGEFVLTARLVQVLEERGIRCVAATTAREVVVEGDRTISRFRFVRFRPYR